MKRQVPTDETELFHQIAEGDEQAFEELFHMYVPRVRPVIAEIIQAEEPVKDIIQEVFLGIWLSREKLPVVSEPRNWIFKIVYHRSYSWLQKQGVRDRAKDTIHIQQQGTAISNFTDEHVALAETTLLIRQAIRLLPPQAKRIYLMSRETGLSIAEIAEQLDLSPQTVKNSLVRSLKAIREHLTRHGIILPLLLLTGRWF